MFNASAALATNRSKNRVELYENQDKLDISKKSRTSVLPWRGQFSPELVEYLIEKNCPNGGFVVDPFCGSGTVLYEAARQKMEAYAVDINPAAICLASFSKVCLTSVIERQKTIEALRDFIRELSAVGNDNERTSISTRAGVGLLDKLPKGDISYIVARASLLLAYGNQAQSTTKKALNAGRVLEATIGAAPFSDRSLNCAVGDARCLKIDDGRADYLITSPPYINVFNYHQNYRPIAEAIGYEPLPMARAEIGANRKYRQNRYMTVVQYCIDLALFFGEARRVLRPEGSMTIVLGRESNVRGVAFPNGELVAAVALEGLGWALGSWRERKFMNRFGETIFEDVITLKPPQASQQDPETVGREVGLQALRDALAYAPTDRQSEISDAAASASKIPPSPYVLEEKRDDE